MTMLETPDEAGLGAFVRLDKGDFIGVMPSWPATPRRRPGPARRLRTVLIGEGPGIRRSTVARPSGSTARSSGGCGASPTARPVGRTIGYVYLRSELEEGARLEVDVFDERVPAVVAADVLVDPRGVAMRA